VRARTRDGAVACPGCGTETARVHEYRERTAADVPVGGRRVLVKVKVRRMRCAALDCAVQTFREQVPGVLDRYQRDQPGAEAVCRDGSGAYGEAVRQALPGAVQVSDRWHLWHGSVQSAPSAGPCAGSSSSSSPPLAR
jgi:transposase